MSGFTYIVHSTGSALKVKNAFRTVVSRTIVSFIDGDIYSDWFLTRHRYNYLYRTVTTEIKLEKDQQLPVLILLVAGFIL